MPAGADRDMRRPLAWQQAWTGRTRGHHVPACPLRRHRGSHLALPALRAAQAWTAGPPRLGSCRARLVEPLR
jgi:hypothetical protein